MKSLSLKEAAQVLRLHPVTLAEWARAGKIPGAAKPGKSWVFLEDGLRAYLDSIAPCPSTESARLGISTSLRPRDAYAHLLGLPTRRPRRNTTTR